MREGYIKLWRKSRKSDVFQHEGFWKLWCLCLMKVNHQPREVTIEGLLRPISVQPGQFITGRYQLHGDYHQWRRGYKKRSPSPYTLWRWLYTLQEMGNLNIQSFNKYSIVTIINWPIYQGTEPCFTEMFHENQGKNANFEGVNQGKVQNLSIKNNAEKPDFEQVFHCGSKNPEHQVSNRRATGEHKQECIKNEIISCGKFEDLKGLLISLPEFCDLPKDSQRLIASFLDKARQSNKTNKISSRRLQGTLTDLIAISGETSFDCLNRALEITLEKARVGQFTFSKQSITGYVKAIAKNQFQQTQEARDSRYEPQETDIEALYR